MSSNYGLNRSSGLGSSSSGYGNYTNKGVRSYANGPSYGRTSSTTPSSSSTLSRFGNPGVSADIYKPSPRPVSSDIYKPRTSSTLDSRSGYTSDYGKSGYVSDLGKSGYTSDYGKSGYTSDYKSKGSSSGYVSGGLLSDHKTGYTSDLGRSGYTSDYSKQKYDSTDRGRTSYGTSTAKYPTYGKPNTSTVSSGSSRTSQPSYGSYSRSVSREDPYKSVTKTSVRDEAPKKVALSYTKSLNRGTDHKPSYTSSRNSFNFPRPSDIKKDDKPKLSYIRQPQPVSKSDSKTNGIQITPVQPIVKSETKKNIGKAPADFTSDSEVTETEEESDEEEEEEETENEFEDYLISRSTSPGAENHTVEDNSISVSAKLKRPKINPNVSRKHMACGVKPEDLQIKTDLPKRVYGLGLSSRPSYGTYFNRYTPSSSSRPYWSSGRTTTTSSIAKSEPRKEEKNEDTKDKRTSASSSSIPSSPVQSKPPLVTTSKNQLTVEPEPRAFSRDNSPNEKAKEAEQTPDVKKDYRKSILNMNLDEREKEEVKRKQEEMRATERRTRKHGEHHRHSQSSMEDTDSLSRNKLNRTGSKSKMSEDLRRSGSRGSLNKSNSHSKLSPEGVTLRRRGSKDESLRSRSSSGDLLESNRSSRASSTSSDEEAEVRVIRHRRRRKGSKEDTPNNISPPLRSQSNEERRGSKESDGSGSMSIKHSSLDSVKMSRTSQTPQTLQVGAAAKPPSSPKLIKKESKANAEEELSVSSSDRGSKSPRPVPSPSVIVSSKVSPSPTEYEKSIVPPQVSIEGCDTTSNLDTDSEEESDEIVTTTNSTTVQKSPTAIHVAANAVSRSPTVIQIPTPPNAIQKSITPVQTQIAVHKSPTVIQVNVGIESKPVQSSESAEESSDDESIVPETSNSPYKNVQTSLFPIQVLQETSMRDSGFSEPSNANGSHTDLPRTFSDSDQEATMQIQLPNLPSEVELEASSKNDPTEKKNVKKFIGQCKDIDSLLNEDSKDKLETFEDFEIQFAKDKRNITAMPPVSFPVIPATSEEETDEEEEEPVRTVLQKPVIDQDKENARRTLGLFIGNFKDIDEMLGMPSPISPNFGFPSGPVEDEDEDPFKPLPKKENKEESEEEEDEEEDGSSAASSSALEEVEASAVRVHDAVKPLQPLVEPLTEEIDSSAVRIRDSRPLNSDLRQCATEIDSDSVKIRLPKIMKGEILKSPKLQLDDCSLQVYKYSEADGDYGNYLDLEATIGEQAEEFEGFTENRKNAIVLRTQLAVRVHAIIERLLNSTGRDLRRALFSLKQIFQDDKDLVHEFVQNDGLACLIKVGSEADQNYQNYILRALGQVMLYVDGMNGVIAHNETIQWLYSLIASKYRLVVKTALKLLLVFVEYTESNSLLLLQAVSLVDAEKGTKPWSNIMKLLNEKDSADMELLVFAVSLINKTLNAIPDQDTYYDITDWLEEQGMERIVQYYMSKQGTDLDLLQQFQIYEAVLRHEDGDDEGKPLPGDARLSRQIPRSRKPSLTLNDRRKSRRHSVGNLPSPTLQTRTQQLIVPKLPETPEEPNTPPWAINSNNNNNNNNNRDINYNESTHRKREPSRVMVHISGTPHTLPTDHNGITPALRRRRERDARNRSLIKEQEESKGVNYAPTNGHSTPNTPDSLPESPLLISPTERNGVFTPSLVGRQRSRFETQVEDLNRRNQQLNRIGDNDQQQQKNNIVNNENINNSVNKMPAQLVKQNSRTDVPNKKSWMLDMMYGKKSQEEANIVQSPVSPPVDGNCNWTPTVMKPRESEEVVVRPTQLRKEGSIKDMQEKLLFSRAGSEGLKSPTSENRPRMGDSSGIISRAKEGLAASQSSRIPLSHVHSSGSLSESKKPENDLQWEQLMNSINRPLVINDLDFTDLGEGDDLSVLQTFGPPQNSRGPPPPPPVPGGFGVLPPPPPPFPGFGPPPPPPPPCLMGAPPPPPPPFLGPPQPNRFGTTSPVPPWVSNRQQSGSPVNLDQSKTIAKGKKTVKLFWKEVKEDPMVPLAVRKTIWDEIRPVLVDTQKLEHLFESRAKDIMNKKSAESGKKQVIVVLDPKRSNAINIGMTKLPPPRTIKTAILKMDSTIMNREGIEKILSTMMPTDEEKSKILEAQITQPEVPLGSAEQCLLTLSSISELEARLRLWAFRLDYDTMEKEVAEPLMDLKQALVEIETNQTFRAVLATLLSIGNFLNGIEARGFNIDYLSKVPEVKDTVHKHSLLHHLCHIVMEKFPNSSDLYSEIGSVTRASKIDFDEVSKNLNRMELECKASWDYLKAIAKHDGSTSMKVRMSEFLADCAERIIVLGIVHRRVINRFQKLLMYLGVSLYSLREAKVQGVCKTLSEFALEYRTTRERVLQQMEKKANHRERNKTRGKMITDMDKFRSKEQEADQELRQLLGNGSSDAEEGRYKKWGTMPGLKSRHKPQFGSSSTLGRLSGGSAKALLGRDENMTDADDEILESLVKTATAQPGKGEPRTRKKARYGDRKSLRRTLRSGLDLSEEERLMLAAMSS